MSPGRGCGWLPPAIGGFLRILAVILGLLCCREPLYAAKEEGMGQSLRFTDIHEPSGLVQLADGRLLLVEDEKDRPVHLAGIVSEDGQPALRASAFSAFPGEADDLEGVAMGPDGRVYAITSHTPGEDGALGAGRRKLLRFQVTADGGYGRIEEFSGLLPLLLQRVAAVATDAMSVDIEGLVFDRQGRLLIGLRQPVVRGRSVVLIMENPAAVFDGGEVPVLAASPILLDLGGGGIRAMTCAACCGGYLLANELESDGGKPRSCLWLWDGNPASQPLQLDFPGRGEMKNIEGLVAVTVEGRDFLLAVCDDGNRSKGKGAHYRFLALDQLAVLNADGGRAPLPGR
jgi:hypothetical protein